MANSTPRNDDVDYSPSATVIPFPRPLPPLRTPLPTSSSSFTLAFSSPSAFSSAFRSSRLSLLSQCHSAARFSCALSASHACRPPFWSSLLRPAPHREQCEEREAAACFRVAKERCVGFADEKCFRGFRDARVGLRKVDWREAGRVGLVLCGRDLGFVGLRRLGSWDEVRERCLVTTCRGSDLIGADFDGFRT